MIINRLLAGIYGCALVPKFGWPASFEWSKGRRITLGRTLIESANKNCWITWKCGGPVFQTQSLARHAG